MDQQTETRSDAAHQHFWTLAAPLLAEPGITRGTIMGFPCLRIGGDFFASAEHKGDRLIIKLPKARVQALIADGLGEPFAPAGRVFKQWLAIPFDLAETWPDRLAEARAFVSPAG